MEKRSFTALTVGFALCAAAQAGDAYAKILFRVANAGTVSLAEMVTDLSKARLIVFGERHDSHEDKVAHRTLMQGLHESGVPLAVGLEMFRADAQGDLDAWVSGQMDEESFRRIYADHWDPRLWGHYNDVFGYARQERIPLVGLNVPRAIVREVARQGFESLDEAQKEELQVSSCDVDPQYEEVLQLAIGGKAQAPDSFERFCQAQLVWDAAMAQNALRYLERNPDRVMLVIAGAWHAWKHGIVEQFAKRSDLPYRVILPSSDDTFLNYDIALDDADYVWWKD